MKEKNIAIITSQGGHLGQMKLIFDLNVTRENKFILITEDLLPKVKHQKIDAPPHLKRCGLNCARFLDDRSADHILKDVVLGRHCRHNNFLNKYTTYFLKKDSLLKMNPFTYLFTLMKLIKILRKEKINLIFTNGAQISIPSVIAGRILGIKTVFIDTVIRVKTPNWSARACYPFANEFWVQHKQMAIKYGRKSKYVGGIV